MATEFERPILAGGELLRQEVDRASGGGPKFHPSSVAEARESLRPQIVALTQAMRSVPEALRGDRLVFEATVVPNYIAASYFPQRLFDAAEIVLLGSRPSVAPYRTEAGVDPAHATRSLILGGGPRSLATLDRLASLDRPTRADERIQEGFRTLQSLTLPTPAEVVKGTAQDSTLYEAVLHPAWDPDIRRIAPATDATYAKWVAFVTSLGGRVVGRYRRAVGGLTFVPVYLEEAQLPRAAEFNPLRALRPMPKLRPVITSPLRSIGGLPTPVPATEATPRSDHRVAVFDGGWDAACPLTGPFTTLHDLTPEPGNPEDIEHGSVVTAATLFGLVDPTAPLPRPGFYVDHYRVLPVPIAESDFDLNWILDRIIETVRSTGHKVVNLSLGPYRAIDDGEPSRWTSELDKLAEELDLVFVVAAGNNGEDDPGAGMNRIQVPADLVNGVAVGACTDASSSSGWTRSPFSALGPGRQGARVRPTGLAFGGDGDRRPFVGLGPRGVWYEGHGTSFATPLVTKSVGCLLPFAPTSVPTANFLRAMAVHFAEPADGGLPVEEVGHGRFRPNLEQALTCTSDTVTVIYQDTLRRGEVTGLPVPLPARVVGFIAVRWTLAISSPVAPADLAEYTLAGVELQFRPHSRRIPFTSPDNTQTVVVNVDRDSAKATALLRQGYRPGENPATRSSKRVRVSEATRRDEGKWETVIHVRDRLRPTSLFEPRFDLAYFARAGGLLREEGVPDLDYTLLVTVEEPKGDGGLYDRVRARYPVLSPIDLRVRSQVRIS